MLPSASVPGGGCSRQGSRLHDEDPDPRERPPASGRVNSPASVDGLGPFHQSGWPVTNPRGRPGRTQPRRTSRKARQPVLGTDQGT